MSTIELTYSDYLNLITHKKVDVIMKKETRLDFDIIYNIMYVMPSSNVVCFALERFKMVELYSTYENLKKGVYEVKIALF